MAGIFSDLRGNRQAKESADADLRLVEGLPVRVFWGHSLGFRVQATGTVSRVFPRSVRIVLDAAVPCPRVLNTDPRRPDSDAGEWPAGFELQGIPRPCSLAWHAWSRFALGQEAIDKARGRCGHGRPVTDCGDGE